MFTTQVTFDIPNDFATGLAIGRYKLTGAVIRQAQGPDKGKIVKHLKPSEVKVADQAQGAAEKLLRMAEQHKKEISIVAIGTAAVGLGTIGYYRWKNHEPKALSDFRNALKEYIDAMRKGNMDIDIIMNLMSSLNRLKRQKNFDKINIQLSAEDLGVIVSRIYEYTLKLAACNSFDLPENEMQMDCGMITDLQNCLEIQKQIFEKAA